MGVSFLDDINDIRNGIDRVKVINGYRFILWFYVIILLCYDIEGKFLLDIESLLLEFLVFRIMIKDIFIFYKVLNICR